MTCDACAEIIEADESKPHVLRTCEKCGRAMRVFEHGEGGEGILIRAGDRFIMPAEWLTASLNPLKSNVTFSRYGINWYANHVYIEEFQGKQETVYEELKNLGSRYDEIVEQSELLKGLDLKIEADWKKAWEILSQHADTAEFWANMAGMLAEVAREAIDNGDITRAVWAAMFCERARAMLIFKQHVEEVVWMGQSAKRLVNILRKWDQNQANADEMFWQKTLKENTYALSQVFAVPVVFIQESAYVGGMTIDRQNAKLVDYLFAVESSKDSVLIEIKTPATKLLGRAYRATYRPSPDLAGALMQILDYRESLIKNIASITTGTPHDVKAFNPKCVIVIGNGAAELNTFEKRRAFENFRANSKDVEIITYDELFRKLEVMASLFSLQRPSPGTT